MKIAILCFVCAAALRAQVNIQAGAIPPGAVAPDTVIAKIDGHDVTYADYEKILQSWPTQLTSIFQQSPADALRSIYTMMYLGSEGAKRKLDDEEPLKSQLEATRTSMMANAEFSYERNHFAVSEDDIKQYYEKNKAHYAEAKIKAIKIGMQEPIPLPHSNEDIKKASEIAVENQRAPKRSEDEARALAAGIISKLRAGGDFAALAKQYSDDADSKDKGGDYGTVAPTSSYPESMKNAVLALKQGEVSEPVHEPNALYIIRVEEVHYEPLDKLMADITNRLRDEHLRVLAVELNKRFQPEMVHPEVFLPSGRPPQSK
ncbi:MAG TPA: peptidylprolyl isomerase [Bryobacteraceae bacterium]|nr:peptidylprolyl isomerase [Bryobacteraceae bacterium]